MIPDQRSDRPDLGEVEIVELDADAYEAAIDGLASLLVDAVAHGASVNFLAGLTLDEAAAWWADRAGAVRAGLVSAVVARERSTARIVGSSLLFRLPNPNAPHRAEVGKVLVHSAARRRGLGRRLMEAIEALARADGRWLLLLDTQADTAADAFYRALGWQELGTLPNHSYRVDGVLAPTTFFWKDLRDTA